MDKIFEKLYSTKRILFLCVNIFNPLTSPGEGGSVFTSQYLSAGAPAQGEAKGLIDKTIKN